MPIDDSFVRTSDTQSSARLWALELEVRQLAEADPAFLEAFVKDPLNSVRQKFGDAAMPNEGEYIKTLPQGGFALVFPRTNATWTFASSQLPEGTDELPDELLECVSAGAGPVSGPGVDSGV